MTYAIGIMCGTSADALDGALISFDEEVKSTHVIGFVSKPLGSALQKIIHAQCEPKTAELAIWCDLNIYLAHQAAHVVQELLRPPKLDGSDIAVIGYHGHTLCHRGDAHRFLGMRLRSTLQLGDGPTLAELTGIPVVNNFRTKDLVHGGCGAPLVPFAHAMLFGGSGKRVAVNNLGGISNITYLSDAMKLGFDTGPANMLIDGLMQRLFGKPFDKDGRIARKGQVYESVIRHFMKDAFFKRSPPKSTGRESYGHAFVEKILRESKRHGLTPVDMMATATEFTVRTLQLAYLKFILPRGLDEVILCGGGALNPVIRERLAEMLPVPVKSTIDYGYDPQQIESVAFALLGALALRRRSNQFGELTGSTRDLSLGQISYPG